MADYTDFKILLDEPADKPKLGFDEYAHALAEIIKCSPPHFTVGIFGDWGSGKTTLMYQIKNLFATQSSIVTVWFNAWRYEREEHLIIPMLDVLREALKEWADSGDQRRTRIKTARSAAATMARAGRALLTGFKVSGKIIGIDVEYDPSKAFTDWEKDDSKAANSALSFYHASFNAMKEAVAKFSDNGAQRIVIFVDDLDRCLPVNALEVLESMKLLFDLEGFVFVVGLNKDIIERSIKLKYHTPGLESTDVQPVEGNDYVKKIFQVPFGLPRISMEQLQEYFNSLINDNALPKTQQKDLQNVVRPHLNYLSEDGSVNPREVKRFINSYTMQAKMLLPKMAAEFSPDVVLALQVMSFRPAWFKLYDAMEVDPALFQQAVTNAINGDEGMVLNLTGSQLPLPGDFVTYVGEPFGQSLLTANLDPYLSSAESTRSSAPGLLKAQAEIAKVRGFIAQAAKGDASIDQASMIVSILSNVRAETSQRTSPLVDQIERDTKNLESQFLNHAGFDDEDEDKRKQWVFATQALVDLVDQNVAVLRRQASFGAS